MFCPHASSNLFHTILKCLPVFIFPLSFSPSSRLYFALSLFSFASLHPEVPFLIEQSSVGCFPHSPPPLPNISPSDGFSHSLSFSLSPSLYLSLSSIIPSAYSSVTGKYYAIYLHLLFICASLLFCWHCLFACMGCCAFKTAACDSGLISLICTNLV